MTQPPANKLTVMYSPDQYCNDDGLTYYRIELRAIICLLLQFELTHCVVLFVFACALTPIFDIVVFSIVLGKHGDTGGGISMLLFIIIIDWHSARLLMYSIVFCGDGIRRDIREADDR